MRQDHVRVSIFVAWGFKVINFQILRDFVLIKAEVEVALSGDLSISISLEGSLLLLGELVLEPHLLHFLLEHGSNFVLHVFNSLVVIWSHGGQGTEELLSGIHVVQHRMVISFLSSHGSLALSHEIGHISGRMHILVV